MATKIIIKKSSTAGAVPLSGNLDQGEVAVNLADRKIYTKDNSNAIVSLGGAYVDSVAPSTPAEGDIWYDTVANALKAYNGSAWIAAGVSSLAALSDVTITTVASGEVLKYDGAGWINNTLAEAGIAATGDIPTNNNQLTNGAGYITGITGENLQSLNDVNITSIASGELLKWTGTEWVNNTLVEAGVASVASVPTNNNQLTNGAGYITTYTVTQGDVTAHQAALSITESQISDLQAYLTAEADTLATVMSRGATTATAMTITNATASTTTGTGALKVTGGAGIGGNVNVGGNVVVAGDLTVNGTTTSVNSNTVNIGDSIITLNSDEVGVPSQNAGFEVERGTSANVSFFWNEANDAWDMGDYNLQNVVIDGGTY